MTARLEGEGRARGRRGFTVARNEDGARRRGARRATERAFAAGAQDNVRLAEDGDEAEGDGVRLAPAGASAAVERIWGMRKKAVGLLGNMKGGRRPIPFVEDTAVPPEHLADYIAEFRAALDRRGLVYGMFGHVDAGVLHVRPAIDMTDPAQEPLIREITDEVAALTQKYGGVLWGEHGKGVRSEYAPAFFGPLYPCLQQIKAAFDPRNQLNPGKIAAPGDGGCCASTGCRPAARATARSRPRSARLTTKRSTATATAPATTGTRTTPMCPSWKGTRERRHSPKGRAQLMREWLRQLAARGVDPVAESRRLRATPGWRTLPARVRNTLARRRGEPDFSHEVKEAMDGCLACKSCAGQCPIKVDVPAFRAKFFELYHGRYLRPVRDHVVGGDRASRAAGWRGCPAWRTRWPERARAGARCGRSGSSITPAVGPRPRGASCSAAASRWPTPDALRGLTPRSAGAASSSCRTPSPATTRRQLLLDLLDLLLALGFRPWLAPIRPNGKPLHVHGFLGAFERVAAANAAMLHDLAATGVDLVGLDPSMTLTYRSEYARRWTGRGLPRVHLVQEWLAGRLDDACRGRRPPRTSCSCPIAPSGRRRRPRSATGSPCSPASGSRSTSCRPAAAAWRAPMATRPSTAPLSEHIYGLSWARHVAEPGRPAGCWRTAIPAARRPSSSTASGLPHPVQALLKVLHSAESYRAGRTADPSGDLRALREAADTRMEEIMSGEKTAIQARPRRLRRDRQHARAGPARGGPRSDLLLRQVRLRWPLCRADPEPRARGGRHPGPLEPGAR